ncbi:TorF family putative porin [Flavisphingomonas formosensis]|uniref:TorF family putative porin n=1 Tax=Flavisphingomonas formosensis TaxID=861534 RepID=UPI0012FC91F6|nr:TorF family putative porin [Sphingomonas formosensis]
MRRRLLALFAAALLTGGGPAVAGAIGDTGLNLSGTATFVSDYRYRGVSQTMGEPAPQFGLTVRQKDGFYAGAWASYVRFYPRSWDGYSNGAHTELDFYGGWTGKVARNTAIDVGFTYYSFPGVTGDNDLGEATLVIVQAIGKAEVRIGGAYDWRQGAMADRVTYLYGEGVLPIIHARFALRAHAGRTLYGPRYQDTQDYWDWSLGGEARFGRVTAGLSYIDTDLRDVPHAGAGVIASVGFAF